MTDTIQERLRTWDGSTWVPMAEKNLMTEAADRIDRLERELTEKKETIDLLLEKMTQAVQMLSAKDKRIEELEDGLWVFACPECGPTSADEDGCCSSCGRDCGESKAHIFTTDQIDRLKQRIEDLEDDKKFWKNPPNGVWIEKDAINEAWEFSEECYARGEENARFALGELGIIPCPKCGGTKWVQTRCIGRVEDHDEYTGAHKCDCRNNGWVMEEKK